MVNRVRKIWKLKKGIYNNAEFGEVVVTKDDTVTFNTLTTLDNSYFIRIDTGGLISTTQASNIATVTGTCTDVRCAYIAFGVKA